MAQRKASVSQKSTTGTAPDAGAVVAPKTRVKPRTIEERRTPSQVRSVDTVEAILKAAERLLVTRGYARASTNAIARLAGVSVGSLYQYFSEKDAIYTELLRRHYEQIQTLLEDHLGELADVRRDPVQTVERLLRSLISFHQQKPALMRAFASELGALRSRRPVPQARTQEAVQQIESLLQRRADVYSDSPGATAWMLVLLVSRTSEWLVHEAPEALDPEPLLQLTGRTVAFLLGQAPQPLGPRVPAQRTPSEPLGAPMGVRGASGKRK